MNPLSERSIARGRATVSALRAALQHQQSTPPLVPRLPGPLATPDQLADDLITALMPQRTADAEIIGMAEVPRHSAERAEADHQTATLATALATALLTAPQGIQVAALEMAMQAIHDKTTAARLLYLAGDRVFNEGRG